MGQRLSRTRTPRQGRSDAQNQSADNDMRDTARLLPITYGYTTLVESDLRRLLAADSLEANDQDG